MSKPKLNVGRMQSELSESAFFKTQVPAAKAAAAPKLRQPQPDNPRPIPEQVSQPVSQSTDRSTGRPPSGVVDRPKAFYITNRLDRRLDEAVRYYQEKHGIRKVDRSAVVNAIMDNDANWTEEALDLLVDRVLGQLTSRLTS